MVTYLADYRSQSEDGPAGQGHLVGAHAGAARLSAADPAYQASASGAEPGDGVPVSAAASAEIPPLEGDEDFGLDTGKDLTQIAGAAGLLLRRVRALHRALPGQQHRQGARPERDRAGRAGLSERARRRRGAKPLLGKHISRGGGVSVHHLRRLRVPVPGGIEHLPIIVGLRRGLSIPASGRTSTAPSCSSIWSGTAIRSACRRASATSSSRRTSCRSSTGRRNTACGSAAWASYDPQGREIVLSLVARDAASGRDASAC